MDAFCVLCHRQEFSIRSDGTVNKHDSIGVEDLLCSTCTQLCIAKSIGTVPWEGKEQLEQIIENKQLEVVYENKKSLNNL